MKVLAKYNTIDIDNARWIAKSLQSNNSSTPRSAPESPKKDSTKDLQLAAKETEQVLVKVQTTKTKTRTKQNHKTTKKKLIFTAQLVRLVANLAINEEIGQKLASSGDILMLCQILGIFFFLLLCDLLWT